MSINIIETDGLSKVYGRGSHGLRALDALTLRVEKGEIFGFLGPNGAGKTTTIRLLLDLIRPTSGKARIFGLDVNQDSLAIRRRIGYLPSELNLWENLTAREIMQYFSRVRGSVDPRFVTQLADRLDFDLSKKMRAYSTGNKRKIGIILALMHKPELLILDEPTSGLDPLMQQVFLQLLSEARTAGQTVFLSSHMLSEVQAVCDRVGILRDGRLQTVDRVSALTHVDFRWVSLRLREPVTEESFRGVPGVQDLRIDDTRVQLRLTGDIDPLLRALDSRYVIDLRTQDPTLEEIFLTYYGDTPALNGKRPKVEPAKTMEVMR